MASKYGKIKLKLRVLLGVGVCFATIIIVYNNALAGKFHYDDYHSILYNPHVRNIGSIPVFFVDPTLFSADVDKAMYRPVLLVSYVVNYLFGGYDPTGYHIVNLGIHIVATILVFLLSLKLFCNKEAALVAMFCFGLHPLCSEPVNYISSRSESLAVLFCLASIYAYISARSFKIYILSYLLFCIALMVKSIAAVLPCVLILFEIIWNNKRVRISIHWPYWLILGGYLLMILSNGFLIKSIGGSPRGIYEQIFTQIKALVYYMFMTVMPISLNIEHQFFVSDSFFEIHVFFCLLFLISTGLILFFVVHRRVFFLLLFGLIFLLPTFIVPLNVLVNEHRLYMSLVAVSFLIAQLYTKTLKYRNLYVFCGLIFCSMIFQRNKVWATEETLWNDSRMKSPAMARPWAFWGIALGKTGNAVLAENAYKGALKIDPYHKAALTNLAAIYLERVKLDQDNSSAWLDLSQRQLEEVLRRDPSYREALQNMGSMYFLKGNWAMADSFFTQCANKHPQYADCAYNIALTSSNHGDYERAKRWIQRSIDIAPNEE